VKNGALRCVRGTEAWLGRCQIIVYTGATVSIGIRPRGRPKSETRKEAISLRVDADVLDAFKSTGEGWQTRMNGILRAAILPARKSLQNDKGKSKRRRA
jgi:hypothetical protein